MIERSFWINRICKAWQKRPIVWLSGVRRIGKTTLGKMIPESIYFNCDLPSVELQLGDPELFFGMQRPERPIVLDEIHRLRDPSRLLKIAADAFGKLRILATGSSTLAATKKFRDTLTGRKTEIMLPAVLWTECPEFGVRDLDHRLLLGGLPEALLSPEREEAFYSEWLDSFYARDIQDLFGIRERTGFMSLLRLVLRQSGAEVDISRLSRECGLSRPTVKAHLEALQVACAVFLLPPFRGGGRHEILKRPKVYAFDTGFVAFARGWQQIRDEDRGPLWEHLVLDVLRSTALEERLGYWRDKAGREVDFVLRRGDEVDAIECKISPGRFEPNSLRVFREQYPAGRNFLVCPLVREPFEFFSENLKIRVCDCRDLFQQLPGDL
jgi:predicted AAA+ superfamily ATPase